MTQPRKSRASIRDPYRTKNSQNTGRRIPHLDKIDPEDPDRINILLTVNRFELAGVEIDERAIEIATLLTRWEGANRAKQSAEWQEEMARKRAEAEERECWVYYIRIGRLIKIGMTTNLASRFSSLRPNEVLAIEPGGTDDEAEAHRKFADLRAGGEFFHPGPALQEHVRELRRRLDAPKWTRSVVPDGHDWFPEEGDTSS